ncbi:MAG: hypothetical protein ACP5KK_00510 [Candidatus Nanoarchaeia archaeon]
MELKVQKGNIFLYYLFDVAYEIALEKIVKMFGKRAEVSKLVCERVIPKYVQYKTAPLLLRLGKRKLTVGKESWNAIVKAKIYDFGIISIVYQIPLNKNEGLTSIAARTEALAENEVCQKEAEVEVKKLLEEIAPALKRPHADLSFWEDYIVVSVKEFNTELSGDEILMQARDRIAKILRCEKEKLSRAELENALKYVLSYYENEFVAIDWQASFIYDPRQSYDVLDVLEYAVAMLLELRIYDELLDDILNRAYTDLSKKIKFYSFVLKNLMAAKLDISEILDKTTNSLKLIGDLYLAKIYKAASQRFYLEELRKSIDDKLKALESIYAMLLEQSHNILSLFLEAAIVCLFILDILFLFWLK